MTARAENHTKLTFKDFCPCAAVIIARFSEITNYVKSVQSAGAHLLIHSSPQPLSFTFTPTHTTSPDKLKSLLSLPLLVLELHIIRNIKMVCGGVNTEVWG